jgi:L-fuconolactonase
MSTTTQPAASSPYLPVRDDWLARRTEAILEPDLPIVDPHHHLWERPGWRYMLDDLLADTNAGHNIVATVFVQCRSMHRASGPEEMKPVGETEFVNGVAAMSASGGYGPTKVCAGIFGSARACKRCWRSISAPAAGGSAASAISPPGTAIRH